jgi:hypothetical protein
MRKPSFRKSAELKRYPPVLAETRPTDFNPCSLSAEPRIRIAAFLPVCSASRHRLEMGPAVCSGSVAALAQAPQADERLVAGERDVRCVVLRSDALEPYSLMRTASTCPRLFVCPMRSYPSGISERLPLPTQRSRKQSRWRKS